MNNKYTIDEWNTFEKPVQQTSPPKSFTAGAGKPSVNYIFTNHVKIYFHII